VAQQNTGAHRALSLRLRLALLVAIVVALVVGIEGYLEYRVFERRGREDLERSATATAQAVADDLELRGAATTPAETRAVLHEFLAAAPTVRDIAAFARDGGRITLVARGRPQVCPTTCGRPRGKPSSAVRASGSAVEDRVLSACRSSGTDAWSAR